MVKLVVCRNAKWCKYEGYCVHKKPHAKQKTIVHNNFNSHYRISNCINSNECEVEKHALCIPVPTKKKSVKRDYCEWLKSQDPDFDTYYEACKGESFYFSEGELKENGFKYCPYCGKKIKLLKSGRTNND